MLRGGGLFDVCLVCLVRVVYMVLAIRRYGLFNATAPSYASMVCKRYDMLDAVAVGGSAWWMRRSA